MTVLHKIASIGDAGKDWSVFRAADSREEEGRQAPKQAPGAAAWK